MKSYVLFLATVLVGSQPTTAFDKPKSHVQVQRKLSTEIALSNGASLVSDITSPTVGTTFWVPSDSCETSVTAYANAQIGGGTPQATYIYVIDISGSINDSEYNQIKTFYNGLTDLIVASDSTKNVGVVQFGRTAKAQTADLIDKGAGAAAAIKASYAGRDGTIDAGATCCGCGLNAAAALLDTSTKEGSSVTVIFLGDGECNTGSIANPHPLISTYSANIISVAALGTVECTAFSEIPGDCIKSEDPEIVGTALIEGKIEINGDTQTTDFGFDGTTYTAGDKTQPFSWTGSLSLGTYDMYATVRGDDVLSQPSLEVTDEEQALFSVVDEIDPLITCPADVNVNTDSGLCTANVVYTTPVGTDNCPSSNTVLTSGLGSGADFPIGSTTDEYTVTDSSGNPASCSFTVTVTDAENPTITCPDDIVVGTDDDVCTAVVSYDVPAGLDNCPSPTTTLTSGLGPGSVFPRGDTVVTYQVTDGAGLVATCSFTVTVVDDQPPAVQCVEGVNPSGNTPGATNQDGFYKAIGTDNCDDSTLLVATVYDSGIGDVIDASDYKFTPTLAFGDTFKYVQAPGAPHKEKEGNGDVKWQFTGNGDAYVTLTDTEGNESDPAAFCRVPPPPSVRHLRGE
jgi:HYR domain/von Willebrand factor type A domain